MLKNIIKQTLFLMILLIAFIGCSCKNDECVVKKVKLVENQNGKKIDVLVDGKLFTSYLYADDISVLKKPVLFPIVSDKGVTVTRGYPLEPKAGERVDHPHHIGSWFNYGDVNGLDFWNNSDAIPEEDRERYGVIRHTSVEKLSDENGIGKLAVKANWLKPNGDVILDEESEFAFYAGEGKRIIDRSVMLSAGNEKVSLKDNKEGLFGIRVARELEHPGDEPIILGDANGIKTNVPVLNNNNVTGHYLNSEGVEGVDAWGKRAEWVALKGKIKNNDITIVIFDHPDNLGYPAYWHARGYGLFAANPLGQSIFSNGKENLDFSLEKGESVSFVYRMLIVDKNIDAEEIKKEYQKFISEL